MSGAAGIDPTTGLTPAELMVYELVAQVWEAWLALPREHPDDAREVCDAVHVVQNLLCTRIARRLFPEAWVDHSEEADAERFERRSA